MAESSGVAAVLAGVIGATLVRDTARLATLLPVALGAALAPFIAHNAEKTAPRELLSQPRLAASGLAVALTADVPGSAAWSAWAAFCLVFAASTFSVRCRAPRRPCTATQGLRSPSRHVVHQRLARAPVRRLLS